MNCTYRTVRDTVIGENGEEYEVYGIGVYAGEELIKAVPDIFTDYQQAKRLADLCSILELSPDHLEDVAADASVEADAYSAE